MHRVGQPVDGRDAEGAPSAHAPCPRRAQNSSPVAGAWTTPSVTSPPPSRAEQRRPVRDAPDKVLRPVDGIHDPAARLATLRPELLPQEPDVGELGTEALHDRDLRLVVGLRDGRQVGLPHDADVARRSGARSRRRREPHPARPRGCGRSRAGAAQDAITDDAALDLRRAAGDGEATGEDRLEGSAAAVQCPGAPRHSWPRRPRKTARRLRHPHVGLAEGERAPALGTRRGSPRSRRVIERSSSAGAPPSRSSTGQRACRVTGSFDAGRSPEGVCRARSRRHRVRSDAGSSGSRGRCARA